MVGLAATIHPLSVDMEVLYRDWSVMTALTALLFLMGYGLIRPKGRINRLEGGILLASYVGYTAYLVSTVLR